MNVLGQMLVILMLRVKIPLAPIHVPANPVLPAMVNLSAQVSRWHYLVLMVVGSFMP